VPVAGAGAEADTPTQPVEARHVLGLSDATVRDEQAVAVDATAAVDPARGLG
jgi:hypothetical protein